MLSGSNANDALLGKKGRQSTSSVAQSQPNLSDNIPSQSNKQQSQPQSQQKNVKSAVTKKKQAKKAQKQFTFVLKILNIIVGIGLAIFGGYCYYGINNDTTQKPSFSLIGYIMPGYIAFSGLIILAIEMHISFICRNMKFLYNYFGRGFFNIYVGIMPLTLLDNSVGSKQQSYQKIAIYLLVGLMMFIGVLYIFSKVFCCAKEGDKRNKKKKKTSSTSSSSQSDN